MTLSPQGGAGADGTDAVALDALTKTFGTHRAVDGLTFTVPAGSIFGLLGRNGAGKTTTIRMIMDILHPDTGTIRVLEQPLGEAVKDRIGYLPEERGLYQKMTVADMLEFHGSIKGLAAAEARRRGLTWLDRLELGAWADRKVEDLSKGMQQKAQFIAAILHGPDLLILDEPFSGMDPVNQEVLKDLILEINRSGCTVIFSTHQMDSAEKMCHEIALIDRGRAVLAGPIASIKSRFGTNSVQIEFEGDGAFLAGLPGVESAHLGGQKAEIRLAQGADPQAILRGAVDRLKIRHFSVVSPTLHSIFIQQVGRERPEEATIDA